MPAQSPTYTWPPTTAGVAETSPWAVNFHFIVRCATVCGVMGSEAGAARVPQTFPPNVDHPPASSIEQSNGAGGVVVVVVVSDAASAVGVDVDELSHAGAAMAAQSTLPPPRRK